MNKNFFEAPELGKDKDGFDKVDPSFLKFRYVANVGQNIVTLDPDPTFFEYLKEHGQEPIKKTILAPGDTAKLLNFFVIVKTHDGKPARLPQAFNRKGFVQLQKALWQVKR